MFRAAASRTVSENVTEGPPDTEAVTETSPGLSGVVYEADATPTLLLVADTGEKLPPAPLSLKLTSTPAIALLYASLTLTCSGCSSVEPPWIIWLFPATMLREAGGPATTVTTKLAADVKPETEAFTTALPDFVAVV